MSASANPSCSGGSGGVGGGGSSSSGGPCGACKFLRRKCVPGCIFAPYFDSEQGAAHFAAVHKVFGASNVSKLLLHIPVHKRLDAVVTICYEAQARLRDPVYGCVAHIFALQQQVVNLQAELSYLQAHLATLELPSPPPPPPPQSLVPPPPLSIADLPSASSVPATYDLSSLFDPMTQPSPSWAMQQRQMDPRQFGGGSSLGSSSATIGGCGGGDLHSLARELLHRHASPPRGSVPCSGTLSSPSISK
ncbi:LOB domain-containing protein 18 [Ricinus communis]|uniref:LOB domain-containing protein, putative n=1 Tax=Ricinus communis TaxID=3988 RepID=B9RDE1_RICCO|nr:LOB domain-containing protein 18 [Ricinus communis]EEF50399.1 LOB domain-containing protein, putative [Ricinus communis]|eukprot:XP_002511730.1 LOB domain-containing protein 18 [Ricinus communis]